jgi:ketosteroid isomerase-like protein
MYRRIVSLAACALAAVLLAGTASAQTWTAEQQEIWKFEEQQWSMAAAKDLTWLETMVHPNIVYWDSGQPMPQNLASLKRWNRFNSASGTTLEQELHPISISITGNIAVVTYYYTVVSENYKKERESVTGRYMDVLMKENGRWRFIAWAGGDDPKD